MYWFMRVVLGVVGLLLPRMCEANMASPVSGGTEHGFAFSSRDVNVLHEWIVVKPNARCDSARFEVVYEIETSVDGNQIPLLFVAEHYQGDFRVLADGIAVPLLKIPDSIISADNTPFYAFYNSMDSDKRRGEIRISFDSNGYEYRRLAELKYFEVALTKGHHLVRISYSAEPATDRSDWIKQYRLNYALSPARHWKSYGTLDITIDARDVTSEIRTSLRAPDSGSLKRIAAWHFKELPADFFSISYKPKVSGIAHALIAIQPEGFAALLAILLFLAHIWSILVYRKRGGVNRISPVAIAGGFLVPLIFLIGWIFFYTMIDMAIGEQASERHGYHFLLIAFYVIIMPVYLGMMLVVDYLLKRRLSVKGRINGFL